MVGLRPRLADRRDSRLVASLKPLLESDSSHEQEQPDGVLPTQDETAPAFRFANEPPDEAVGQTIGRYKLLERIGEGGCGVVYVAEQTEPVRRRVALRDHPNIAKVLDAGTTGDDRGADFSPHDHSLAEALRAGKTTSSDREIRRTEVRAPIRAGRPYFMMELVRGIRITDYCDQDNPSTKERSISSSMTSSTRTRR